MLESVPSRSRNTKRAQGKTQIATLRQVLADLDTQIAQREADLVTLEAAIQRMQQHHDNHLLRFERSRPLPRGIGTKRSSP